MWPSLSICLKVPPPQWLRLSPLLSLPFRRTLCWSEPISKATFWSPINWTDYCSTGPRVSAIKISAGYTLLNTDVRHADCWISRSLGSVRGSLRASLSAPFAFNTICIRPSLLIFHLLDLYYLAFPNDPSRNKVLVYLVFLFETAQTLVVTDTAYNVLGSGYGNLNVFGDIGATWFNIPFITGIGDPYILSSSTKK